jgi:hypothetical protein
MRCLIVILSILLIFGLPVEALAQEPADGVINGQVINGTEGGSSVAEVEVILITYVDDVVAGTRTAKTDEKGEFQFDNVVIEYEYLISAKYMEVYYYYSVAFEPGETTAYVEVGVCDATTSDESIRVGLAHIIVTVEEESIQLTEVFWLVNDEDRTYVGTDGVLVFTLPEGALSFEAPQELMLDYQFLKDNKVTYLVPFPPGERQLVFSYMLAKPDSAEFTIPLEVDYPTDSLELMVEGEDIEVAVDQLAPAEPVITDTGERFIHFWGENLSRGMVLNLHLHDTSGGSNLLIVILGVIIVVIIAGIAVYLMKIKKRQNTNE